MKASNYNFFIEHNSDSYLAYNSRSNSLAIIEKENYQKYSDFVLAGKEIDDTNLIEKLKEGYFLIDDDVDELKILRFKMYKDRMNNKSLGLTIAPTSDCNFRCVYCYEKNSIKPKSMTPEIEGGIINLIESLKDNLSSLSVSWYGGEPLMRFDIIERLSKRILDLCESNNIFYDASIVTNGYLLTKEIAIKMKEFHINQIQITIDGLKEVHNKRRFLANGKGTFDKIIENLVECRNYLPRVNLRINVDKSNYSSVMELYSLFKEKDLLDVVFPYLGLVKANNGCYKNEKCLNVKEFSELTFDFQKDIQRDIRTFYPITRSKSCGADSLYSFVIDSDGSLYKCWNDIGIEEKKVGNILAQIKINMNNINYLTLDATQHPICKDCKYLPICMGGCPVTFAEKSNCTYFKYHLDKYLKHVANNI